MKRGRSGGPPSKTQRDAYRARVDREAAAIILQDELDTRAGRPFVHATHPRTPRRPADDDPLRRTPAGPTRHARPARTIPTPTRPRRSPSISEPIPRGAAAAAAVAWRRAGRLPQVPVFALVLAALVLAVALTALRPVVGGAVMAVAEDNPAALQLPFVADIVARGPRRGADDAGLDRPDPGRVPGRGRATRRETIATRLEDEGLLADSRAFVFIAIDRQADRRRSSRARSSCART